LAHGLIRASFVPPQPIQELRDLTRTRKELTREIVCHTQRIQSVLENANIKLASVITDTLGVSGRRVLKAIVGDETDGTKLAQLGSSRLAASPAELAAVLTGRIRDHHRFLIAQHLKTIEQIETTMVEFDARIEAVLGPFQEAVERLTEIPGISRTVAEIIVAEIGIDMSQFPNRRLS
jgi:transposase